MRYPVLLFFLMVASLPVWAEPPTMTRDGLRQLGQLTPLADQTAVLEEDRPLLVTFFASWCPPCTAEFRELNKLRDAFPPDRLNIIAINLYEDYAADPDGRRMNRFLKRTNPAFPLVHNGDTAQMERLFGPVERIPTVFIYDRNGRIIYRFVHARGATKTNSSFTEMAAALRGE